MLTNPFTPGSYLVTYLRDSGGDEQDLSIPQQENVVRQWAAENGCILSAIFKDEARSGTSTVGRDQFDQMISHLLSTQSRETGLVIWKFNRFGRNYNDAQYYKAYLRRNGIIIYSLNDTVPEGEDGLFFESAIDWMNARYSRDLSIDVKRGLYHNLHQSGAIPGTPPRGFKRTPIDLGHYRNGQPHIVHRWDPDLDLAPLVLKAFEMRAAGSSYAEITDATHIYSLKNKTSWNHFFTNPIYKGELRYGDQIITDYCMPIVPPHLWDAVQKFQSQKIMSGPKNPNHPRRKNSPYILSGLAHCAACGSPLNGETIRSRAKNHTNRYYACTLKKRSTSQECNSPNIPKQALEDIVIDQIIEHILTIDNLMSIRKQIQTDSQKDIDEQQGQVAAHRKQYQSLQRQITNIVKAISSAGHSPALISELNTLETQSGQLGAQIAAIETQISHLQNLPDEGALTITAQHIKNALQSADRQTQKNILSSIINRIDAQITVNNKLAGMIYYYLPGEFTPMGLSHRWELNP
jgi:site-specific DNA recombinase